MKLQSALMQMPDGRLTRQALIDAGDLNISYAAAAKLEFKRMIKIKLRPDTSADERRKLVEQYKYMRQIRRRHRMWKTLEEFLNGHEKIAGRLMIETVTEAEVDTRYLRVLGKKEIHETFIALPLLHGDATKEIELVRYHLPNLKMLQEINVLAPHERITQIVGLAVGKKILALPDKSKQPAIYICSGFPGQLLPSGATMASLSVKARLTAIICAPFVVPCLNTIARLPPVAVETVPTPSRRSA